MPPSRDNFRRIIQSFEGNEEDDMMDIEQIEELLKKTEEQSLFNNFNYLPAGGSIRIENQKKLVL